MTMTTTGSTIWSNASSLSVSLDLLRPDGEPGGPPQSFTGEGIFLYMFTVDADTTVTVDYDVLGTSTSTSGAASSYWWAMQGYDVQIPGVPTLFLRFPSGGLLEPGEESPYSLVDSVTSNIVAGTHTVRIRSLNNATGNSPGDRASFIFSISAMHPPTSARQGLRVFFPGFFRAAFGEGAAAVRKIPFRDIPIDRALPWDLLDDRGGVCFRAGQVVKRRHLSAVRARADGGLFVREEQAGPGPAKPVCDVQEAAREDERSVISVRALNFGAVLERDIHDEQGVLLLGAGSMVPRRFLEALRARGIERIVEAPGEQVPGGRSVPESEAARRLDTQIDVSDFRTAMPRPAAPSSTARRLERVQFQEARASGNLHYDKTLRMQARTVADVLDGKPASVHRAQGALVRFLELIEMDATLAPLILDLKRTKDEYLCCHGVNVSVLTMALATHMGFAADEALQAGLGALFHDVGMLDVDESIRLAQRPLTQDEWQQIEWHTTHTVDAPQRVNGMSRTSLLVAHQIHERCDGSGYPRRRSGMFSHPLPKVAAVADMFIAAGSWRPYRPARSRYGGVLELLAEIRIGRLEGSVVRAFLDCMSLFPVGSYVRLSNGGVARVMRSSGSQHTKPLVQRVDDDLTETGEFIDLTKTGSLRVAAAIEPPFRDATTGQAA